MGGLASRCDFRHRLAFALVGEEAPEIGWPASASVFQPTRMAKKIAITRLQEKPEMHRTSNSSD